MDALIHQSLFYEIAALLAIAAAVGILGAQLRQPLIVSFIAVGIAAGPAGLDVVRSGEHIALLSELGIAVLLFLVGIRLDVHLVRTLGAVALTTGLGQVAFTSVFGFMIGLALGFDPVPSLYIAVALTFSSTIIIVKLLSDKREIDSLHGRIALGFLIVQDIVVVLAMIVLSAVGVGARQDAGLADVAATIGAGALLLGLVLLFVRYVAGPLTNQLARSPELLLCFALAMAALFAAVGDHLGLGKELGGLLAGVSLASTPYRDALAARLTPLRDFLLLFFFVALGSRLDLEHVGAIGPAAIVFSVFVLVGNPLIVLAIMGAMGYRRRTGFLAGLTVAQISEFSLIFMAMGVSLGHVAEAELGLVTVVGLITIGASTYLITYSHLIYPLFEPLLGVFERRGTPRESADDHARLTQRYDVVIFGLGRFGTAIAQRLRHAGWSILGVDFDPEVVRDWRREGLDAVYGDIADPEFVGSLPQDVRWALSTVPAHPTGVTHLDPRTVLIQALRRGGFAGRIAVTSHRAADAARLREAGADLVFEPFQDAADRAVELLRDAGAGRAP